MNIKGARSIPFGEAPAAMACRTCELCGRVFKYPAHLARHRARKTPCDPILERAGPALEDPAHAQKTCRFCGRYFSSYTSMRRHVRTTCKIAPNTKNGGAGMEVLYEHTIQRQASQLEAQQEQIAEMAARQNELLGMVRQLVEQKSGGGRHACAGEVALQMGDRNRVSIDNRKQVIVNVFGEEGLDHATVARIKAILDESLTRPALPEAASAAVLKTAMLVYSDPDHPENLTCYLPNKKTDDVLVHSKGGWEVQPASLVLPPMAQKSVDTLFGRQPFEDADEYGPLMKELADNERRYSAGTELRPVLVRNKDLLARALDSLPVAGRARACEGAAAAAAAAEPAARAADGHPVCLLAP